MEKDAYRIGLVGLGRMGANMARHLKDEGYAVTALYDIDPVRSTALAKELGSIAAGTPADVRGGPTMLDRITAKLSYKLLVDVMLLVSHIEGFASQYEKDYKPHLAFVH